MHISDLEWNTGLADIILKGLQELQQDIGNINNNLKNGNYIKLYKKYEKNIIFHFLIFNI